MGYFFILLLQLFLFKAWAGEVTTTIPMPSPSGGTAIPDQIHPNSCTSLRAGESRIVDEDRVDSPSGVRRKYRITREAGSRNIFRVDVNLDFSPSDRHILEMYGSGPAAPSDLDQYGSADTLQESERQSAIISRVRICFAEQKGRLKSPDGTTINLNLATGADAIGVPKVRVGFDHSEHRSNSGNWASFIDCPTIVHEVLHLLGLCDGYREKTHVSEIDRIPYAGEDNEDKRYSANKYDCRSIEPLTSVMRNQRKAIGDNYDVLVCPIQPGANAIGNKVSSLPRKCPGGLSPIATHSMVSKSNFHRWVRDHAQQYTFYYKVSAPHPHPLANAQTRLITQPGCEHKAGRYTQCAQNAYRTHSLQGCLDRPDYCTNGDHLE